MKMKTFYLFLIAFSVFTISCKKEKDDIAAATSAKIKGTWQIDSVVINQQFNGTISKVSYPGTAADYVEFKSDGNMQTKFQGSTSVSTYKVRDSQVMTINGDSAAIQELTDNKFILRTRADAGSLGYLETIYYLKR